MANLNNQKPEEEKSTKGRPGRKPGCKTTVAITIDKPADVEDAKVKMDDNASENDESHNNEFGAVVPYLRPEKMYSNPYKCYSSNYFKAITKKVSIIIKALKTNLNYVGAIKMCGLMLSEEGQLVFLSNQDKGVNDHTIELKAYLPYINDEEICVIDYGSVCIRSPRSIYEELNRNTNKYSSPSIAPYGSGMYQPQMPMMLNPYGMPSPLTVPTGVPTILFGYPLTLTDLVNGLCYEGGYGHRQTNSKYNPICLWNIDVSMSVNDITKAPYFVIPEEVALKLLKGKSLPLIFAGSVPKETIPDSEESNSYSI